MRMSLLAFLVVMMSGMTFSSAVDARMYQWVDPVTGSLQMSGKPPAWYRSNWEGPRVRVMENGILIDDTEIAVSDEQMEALRDEAFQQFEDAKELQALKRLESDALKEVEREERLSQLEDFESEEIEEPDEGLPNQINEDTIEQLKDLIDQWDTLNLPFGAE